MGNLRITRHHKLRCLHLLVSSRNQTSLTVDPKAHDRYQEFKARELETYKKENYIMKRTIQASLGYIHYNIPAEISLTTPDNEKEHWSEKSTQFNIIRSKLLETTIYLCKLYGRAVSTREVMNCFENRHRTVYRTMNNPGETIPRRCRELVAEGYLIRPEDGSWFPGPQSLCEAAVTTSVIQESIPR